MVLTNTPLLVLDLEVMESNISNMMSKADKSGIKLRPHIKTHKSAYIAKKQIQAGANGITVATLGEAEIMNMNGINDILIAYPIVGSIKLERLRKLVKNANIIVSLDSLQVAKGISDVGEKANKTISVYVEIDSGLRRCGRSPGKETLELIEQLIKIPNIKILGLMTHAGHSYKAHNISEVDEISKQEGEYLVSTKELVKEKLGLDIQEISVGSTPTAYSDLKASGVTEMRPGTYIFNDAGLFTQGVVQIDDCALSIYSTVVSKPKDNLIIIDAGSKTLTSDKGAFTNGFGLIKGYPGLVVDWLTEEHGMITIASGINLDIGDIIEIIPNHVCTTVNLTDELIGIRNNSVEKKILVDARGKNK